MESLMFDLQVPAGPTSRARSFGGCGTCRARHVKCDQAKPICFNCASNGRVCTGFAKRIFFDTEDDGGNARYRQTLFSDEERERMAEVMTASVSIDQSSAALADIDENCEAAIERSESILDIRRGPFSAFLLPSSPPTFQTAFTCTAPVPETLLEPFAVDWDTQVPEEFNISPMCTLERNVNFSSGTAQIIDMLNTSQDLAWDRNGQKTGDSGLFWPGLTTLSGSVATDSFMQDAHVLLKHYADSFIPSLTPFRHAKTPWHILFLPNAMITMTAITIGNDVDEASLTNLLGILAISALDIHHRSFNSKWDLTANHFRSHAQRHVVQVLKHALDRPKSSKYKTTVMAILTMVQLSLLDGSWDQTESYLLEAEKVIRLRGLTKAEKSRKVRILHHCYAYIRIFHESLSLSSMQSKRRLAIMNMVERSGIRPKSEDNLSFRLNAWPDFDKTFEQMKDREQGENDLHLSIPGIWPRTLYPEIFGVSESWLALLSQVIRLSNEKELERYDPGTSRLLLKEFTARAKSLEIRILRWESNSANAFELMTAHSGNGNVNVDWIVLESLLNALCHALAVYFYRKIYDVEPELLQSTVAKVKDSLIACKASGDVSGRSLQGLLWAAFVAGCEALDVQLQNAFSEWFDSQILQYRGSLGVRMRQTMQEVWGQRGQNEMRSATWLDRLGGV